MSIGIHIYITKGKGNQYLTDLVTINSYLLLQHCLLGEHFPFLFSEDFYPYTLFLLHFNTDLCPANIYVVQIPFLERGQKPVIGGRKRESGSENGYMLHPVDFMLRKRLIRQHSCDNFVLISFRPRKEPFCPFFQNGFSLQHIFAT
jgi:hypothetical protein